MRAELTLPSFSPSDSHFGTFVFTTTLLPLLRETAKEAGSDVRIVTVSSNPIKSLQLHVELCISQIGSNAMMQTPKNWKLSRQAFKETHAPTQAKLNAFMVKFVR